MRPAIAYSRLPDALREDARDAFLPCAPPRGFRNLGWRGEAPEALRWRGCGGLARTEALLDAIAPSLPAPRMAAGAAALARFVEIDLFCAPDDPAYPPVAAPWTPPHRRRLMLAILYGDGPAREPERYDEGAGPMAGLRPLAGALRAAGPDPFSPLSRSSAPDFRAHGAAEAVAAAFACLHALALGRLSGVTDRAARFAAAQRVTRAVYRDIVFHDLAPATLRADVLAACAAEPLADPTAADADDAASELAHVALPLWTAAADGDAGIDAPTETSATPAALARALRFGAAGGVLGVESLAALLAPRLATLPAAARWIAVDGAARTRLVADWAARGPLAERAWLRSDPPPLALLALESAAPADLGGGEGRRLGAMGTALVAEGLLACRHAGEAEVERDPRLPAELATVFPFDDAPRTMEGLLATLRRSV